MRTGVFLGALFALLIPLALGSAQAQFDDDWRAQERPGAVGALPLDRLLPQIRRSHPGRFYDAEGPFMGGDGQLHYRLKWMTPDGRIIWFDADARTGRVLGEGGGRHLYDEGGSFDRSNGSGGDGRDRGGDGRWRNHDHFGDPNMNGRDNGNFDGDFGDRHHGGADDDHGGDRGGDWQNGPGGNFGGGHHHSHGG